MKTHESHRAKARRALDFHVITVSSSRANLMNVGSDYKDESGDLAVRLIQAAGHKVKTRRLVSDSKSLIESAVKDFLQSGAHTLTLIGGTGVSPDDITVETVSPFFEKELTGFGELLRSISYQTIGSAALLTRATAGITGGKLIVCLPGSPSGVETGLENFLPEFPHIVSIAGGHAHHGKVNEAVFEKQRVEH